MNLALGLGQHLGPRNEPAELPKRSGLPIPASAHRIEEVICATSSSLRTGRCRLGSQRQPDGVGPRVVVGAVADQLGELPWPSWTSTAVSWRPRIKDLAVKALADPAVARPMTIPGVDAIPAISIVAAVGEFSRFGDAEKVTMRKPASWQRTPWPAAASWATTTPTPLRRRATSLLG
jgi:hypothetical protein